MTVSQQIDVLAKALSVADGIDPGFADPAGKYYDKAQDVLAALKVVGGCRVTF